MRVRDFAFEALAEVTASDPSVARGELNAGLRDIRKQEPSLAGVSDSYLLSAEIHERAKMYRHLWPEMTLTPNALSQHWVRVKAETKPKKVYSPPEALPQNRREENLNAARQAMKELWG